MRAATARAPVRAFECTGDSVCAQDAAGVLVLAPALRGALRQVTVASGCVSASRSRCRLG